MKSPFDAMCRRIRRHTLSWCWLTAVVAPVTCSGGDLYQLNSRALGDFSFEGLAIGDSVATMKRVFPKAEYAYDRATAQADVAAYTVAETETADGACFYFFHDALYQFNIEYKAARADAAGGMAVMVDRLIRSLGPPDHADILRRTWFEPGASRRADFYVSHDRGLLIVTDTSRSATIQKRLTEGPPQPVTEPAFQPSLPLSENPQPRAPGLHAARGPN